MEQVGLPGLPPAPAGKKTKAEEKVDPIEEMVGALTDPIIAYSSPWMDAIPERMKKELPIHRLGHIMLCLKGEADWGEVCDLEALIYLYPAALEIPFDNDWAQIYLYLGTKYMREKAPEDIRVEALSNFQQRQLRELKRWIREKKVKARKERMQQEKKAESKEKEVVVERYEQLKLF